MKMTLGELAAVAAGELTGDPHKVISNAAPFDTAGPDDITFAAGANFLKKINRSKAGAVIVPRSFAADTGHLIRTDNPQLAFARVLERFFPPRKKAYDPGVPRYVGKNYTGGDGVSLGPFVAIGDNVTIGDRTILHPGVVVGDDVAIGSDVEIHPNVSVLDRTRIGDRVIIHAGTVIGSDGFGFAPDGSTYYKIPQTGFVQIDDDVEIGAGNTIDRAAFGKTWIQRGAKTDNLVHIAHNVTVGEDTVLVAQVGISGSVTIGRHVILAGQVGVAGHLEIGDNVVVGARGGVSKTLAAGQIVSGAPEMPHRDWLKVQRIIPRLPELKKKIEELEKRLNLHEEGGNRDDV